MLVCARCYCATLSAIRSARRVCSSSRCRDLFDSEDAELGHSGETCADILGENKKKGDLDVAVIGGAAGGGVLALCLLLACIWKCKSRKKGNGASASA